MEIQSLFIYACQRVIGAEFERDEALRQVEAQQQTIAQLRAQLSAALPDGVTPGQAAQIKARLADMADDALPYEAWLEERPSHG